MTTEPHITINGRALTAQQATTVRVACNAFAGQLQREGLGDDEHGGRMTEAYLSHLGEILQQMTT